MFNIKNLILEELESELSKEIAFNTKHHGEDINELSKKLHQNHLDVNDHDVSHIKKYTNYDSSSLNGDLINGKKLNVDLEPVHHAILNNSKPANHEFHVFSGIGRGLARAFSEHKEGDVFHSPAHISTTHNIKIANSFAHKATILNEPKNYMSVHIKPKDKILHIPGIDEPIGYWASEHETILPSGTNLKLVKKSKHGNDNVYHFQIHSQVLRHDPNND